MQVSLATVEKVAAEANRWKTAKEKADGLLEKAVGTTIQTVEITSAAFTVGFVRGYYGEPTFQGIPLDLAAGIGGHVAGYLGMGGKYGEHLHNLSDGILAGYTTVTGAELGAKLKAEHDKAATAPTTAAGAFAVGGGARWRDFSGRRPGGLTMEQIHEYQRQHAA